MVAVKIIEIPIQFSRNLPKIAIQFQPESDSNTHWGKTVSIQLLDKTTNQQSWSYTHLLQPTNTLHFTGVDYGRYQLQITPATPDTTIPIPYLVMYQHQQHQFQEINHLSQQDVSLLVVDKPDSAWIQGNTGARFLGSMGTGGGALDTALLTSGSFLMMSSSGL